jgi:predicted dienelactone hydrolase
MKIARTLGKLGLALGAGAAGLFAGAWALSTETRSHGDSTVGFTQFEMPVDHRVQDLPVHIWYPAQASGMPELIGQNALMYGFHAQRDAAPRDGALPLIVFSHGSGGRMSQMHWLATELAERGYVVAGVNHPGTTSMDSDPHQTIKIWERPADLRALLDLFEEGAVAGISADMSRVASAGFSLGGHSALALGGAELSKAAFISYCDENIGMMDCGWLSAGGVDFTQIDAPRYEASHADPRIGAIVALDPALPQAMTAQSLAQIEMPSLIVNFKDGAEVPAGVRAQRVAAAMPNAEIAVLEGSWHFSALGECSALGRIIIGASGFFTGEANICGEAARHLLEIQRDTMALVVPFLEENL